MTGNLATTFRKMDTISQLWLIVVFISVQLVSPSYCTDKLFVAEARNAEILMAEAIDYSFINTTFIKIPLNGLKLPVGVEFDPRSELIYWTDAILHTVNRAALDGSSQEVIAQLQNVSEDFEYPYGIALNLDDDKVYWTDQYRDVIEMANLDGTDRTDLLTTGFNAYPNAIVYSSFRRKIYWTDRGNPAKLEMANPDGTERQTLLHSDNDSHFTHPTGLCLDSIEQKLYWTDITEDRIENLNLDDLQRFVNFPSSTDELDLHPLGISVYFEDIYFSDIIHDGVYAIDFPEGRVFRVNQQLHTPTEIHIYADTSCRGNNLCAANGTCVVFHRPQKGTYTFVCKCDEGYNGTHCENDINYCHPDSCMNGGTCIDGIDSFACGCVPGFTDSICSINIGECDSDPCMNGGTCIDGVDSFTCDCVAGYTNSTCSTNINDCDPEPCMNGGTCIDGVDSFTCNCVTSYTGSTCDTAFDVCLWINPCGMNEECTNTDMSHSGYYCNCSESFERRNSVCMEITCPLPNHPYSHVVKAESLYRGGDFITIQCDENEESVVWQCNETSGQWKQLADLDCKPEDEPVGGISTGAIIGILAAVVIVLVLGMIFYFLYKMANRKRQTTTDGVMLSEQRNQQLPEVQGRDNRGDFPQFNRQFGRTGTLPAPPNFTSLDHKEGPTPDDLPPAYDFISGPECSGGVCSSDYEEIIHVCTKPDDDLPSPKPDRYIDVQMNT